MDSSYNSSSSSASSSSNTKASTTSYTNRLQYHHTFDCEGGGSIHDFLQKYVPSKTPPKPSEEDVSYLRELAMGVTTGNYETVTFSSIERLLSACQKDFSPTTKMHFQNKRKSTLPSEPDILGSYPGTSPANAGWESYALPIIVNTCHDPASDSSSSNISGSSNALSKLDICASHLLSSSMSNYIFVLAIYLPERTIRIYRYDRSGCVSCGFSYWNHPEMLREFLFRFVNPSGMGRVVGWDESIRVPSEEEVRFMQGIVWGFDRNVKLDRTNCRWMRVRLDRDAFGGAQDFGYDDINAFTFGDPLYKSTALFSRATYVTRALVHIPNIGWQEVVLKDVWREKGRRSEYEFYHRAKTRYKDLREHEAFEWVKELYDGVELDKEDWIPGLSGCFGNLDLSEEFCAEERGYVTSTTRLQTGDVLSERIRSRTISGPVGRRLDEYVTTRELVIALRDAIVGHYIALCCGVLHRDVSVGNILFVKTPSGVREFLHDFDCATFVPCVPGLSKPEDEAILKSQINPAHEISGTHQFMAVEILKKQSHMKSPSPSIPNSLENLIHAPHHDLESFFWVLLWVILRHTQHNHPDGKRACGTIFGCYEVKQFQLYAFIEEPVEVGGNKPLSRALERFGGVVKRSLCLSAERERAGHREVVGILDGVVREAGWPVPDVKVLNLRTRQFARESEEMDAEEGGVSGSLTLPPQSNTLEELASASQPTVVASGQGMEGSLKRHSSDVGSEELQEDEAAMKRPRVWLCGSRGRAAAMV